MISPTVLEVKATDQQRPAQAPYANGRGVAQDDVTAYMWFSLAASGASDDVRDEIVKARDRAAERLTPDQLADARRRVREWQATHPREP